MKRIFFALPLIVTLAAAQTLAGDPPDFGQSIKHNAEALQQYSYKRRVEVSVKGHSTSRVESVGYVNGVMETVPLDTPQRQTPQAGGRGLRGIIVKHEIAKKKDEMKQEVTRLTGLLRQYSPESDAVRSALRKASVSRIGSGPATEISLQATGIVSPQDSLRLVWNVAQRRPDRIEIRTLLDKKPVELTIQYASLADGPFYQAHTILSAPNKDLRVTIDRFEYTRAAAVNE